MSTTSARPPDKVPGTIGRRSLLAASVLAGGVVAGVTATSATAKASTQVGAASDTQPTVVIEHGAFADASGWATVIEQLQGRGFTVFAPPNPLRGIPYDSAYLADFLGTLTGPVVLVGHSYAGAVITNAATGNANVKALVYIAAYALAEGETCAAANALGGGSTDLLEHIVTRPYPDAPAGDADGYIDPAYFRQLFAQDVPAATAAEMAVAQRPAALSAFAEPSGVPAWQTIPTWYLVSANDHTIPPQAERAMALRAHAHTVEIASSHAAMVSHPAAVTNLILTAAAAVSAGSAS
jgi:pimeloyl-ACP methyl ester carboxylesterase